jgi:hypothetical protein
VFTTAQHRFLSWARWIQSTSSNPKSHLRQDWAVSSLQAFQPKFRTNFSTPPCALHGTPISFLLNLFILIIYCEQHCSFTNTKWHRKWLPLSDMHTSQANIRKEDTILLEGLRKNKGNPKSGQQFRGPRFELGTFLIRHSTGLKMSPQMWLTEPVHSNYLATYGLLHSCDG